jgi:quercetin dioxygenase-like cupin family protein
MGGLTKGSFEKPDEVRTPDKTTIEVVDLGGAKAARFTFEPGWRWSECIKPVAKTESCQGRHIGLVVSGTLSVSHDDGSSIEISAGEAYHIAPGHDAWVVGDQPFVSHEFETTTVETYARPS